MALPIKPVRTLRFTTDEATWISLDVSPDGKTIVFDPLGDLYTLPMAGGKATRITSGMAWDCMPRWSPDGRTIAFISDRDGGDNLWLVGADGSGARWERWMLQSGDMTPMEVLRIATIYGAESIGYGADLGSIEPAKLADLQELDALRRR